MIYPLVPKLQLGNAVINAGRGMLPRPKRLTWIK